MHRCITRYKSVGSEQWDILSAPSRHWPSRIYSRCRDNRVDAAVEMDGELNVPIGPSGQFAGPYFKGHNPPLLMINGTKDTLSPYGKSQALYTNAPVASYFALKK